MAQIKILLEKQCLTIKNQEIVSSGDVNYDTCLFEFDASWTDFLKTGVFYQDKNNVQYAVLDGDGTCTIPAQAMAKEGNMYIGVFGVSGSRVMTSTVERVYIRQGAISGDTVSTDPGDDVFLAIIAQYQQMAEIMKEYDATAAELSKILENLNAYNVSDVMERLKIVETDARSALEKIDCVSGGLRFGVDADGNCGYIAPESDDIIAFGGGKADGSNLKTYKWQAVECDDCISFDGRSWIADVSQTDVSNKALLFLAINVPDACKSIMNINEKSSCAYMIYLNDEIVSEDTNASIADFHKIIQLKKGINYIYVEFWRNDHNSTTGEKEVKITLSPIVA